MDYTGTETKPAIDLPPETMLGIATAFNTMCDKPKVFMTLMTTYGVNIPTVARACGYTSLLVAMTLKSPNGWGDFLYPKDMIGDPWNLIGQAVLPPTGDASPFAVG